MQFRMHPRLRRSVAQMSALLSFVLLGSLLLSFSALLSLSAKTPAAVGATFVVNTLGEPASVIDETCDATSCTLREAINAANNTAGLDTITFADGLTGNIQLVNRITIDDDLLLIGPGAGEIAIVAAPPLDIFRISGASSVTMRALTIQGATGGTSAIWVQNGTFALENSILQDNDVNGFGGAITNSQGGSVIVSSSTISNNLAIQGAAIYNYGNLTVINSTFQGNETTGAFGEGGAIRNEGGTVMITDTVFIGNDSDGSAIANKEGGITTVAGSTFDGNQGSAIYNVGITSTLVVTDSTFHANAAGTGSGISNGGGVPEDPGGIVTVTNSIFTSNEGGAIGNRYGGTFTLESSTVHSNTGGFTFGGGILNERSVMTIRDSTISNNQAQRGAGIANRRASTLTIDNSTISGNYAVGEFNGQCGGISNDGINSLDDIILTITNSTISGNRADTFGGGVCTLTELAQTTINNSTIVSNRADNDELRSDGDTGGGIYHDGGTLSLGSTLLAGNYRGGDSLDNVSQSSNSPGTITSLGFNLSDTGPTGFGDDDITNSAPMLAPLDDNGGPTATHALFAGSPAIDAGSNANCPATDQRGVTRPLDGDEDSQAVCDIGAFEVDTPNVPVTPEQETLHLPSLLKQ